MKYIVISLVVSILFGGIATAYADDVYVVTRLGNKFLIEDTNFNGITNIYQNITNIISTNATGNGTSNVEKVINAVNLNSRIITSDHIARTFIEDDQGTRAEQTRSYIDLPNQDGVTAISNVYGDGIIENFVIDNFFSEYNYYNCREQGRISNHDILKMSGNIQEIHNECDGITLQGNGKLLLRLDQPTLNNIYISGKIDDGNIRVVKSPYPHLTENYQHDKGFLLAKSKALKCDDLLSRINDGRYAHLEGILPVYGYFDFNNALVSGYDNWHVDIPSIEGQFSIDFIDDNIETFRYNGHIYKIDNPYSAYHSNDVWYYQDSINDPIDLRFNGRYLSTEYQKSLNHNPGLRYELHGQELHFVDIIKRLINSLDGLTDSSNIRQVCDVQNRNDGSESIYAYLYDADIPIGKNVTQFSDDFSNFDFNLNDGIRLVPDGHFGVISKNLYTYILMDFKSGINNIKIHTDIVKESHDRLVSLLPINQLDSIDNYTTSCNNCKQDNEITTNDNGVQITGIHDSTIKISQIDGKPLRDKLLLLRIDNPPNSEIKITSNQLISNLGEGVYTRGEQCRAGSSRDQRFIGIYTWTPDVIVGEQDIEDVSFKVTLEDEITTDRTYISSWKRSTPITRIAHDVPVRDVNPDERNRFDLASDDITTTFEGTGDARVLKSVTFQWCEESDKSVSYGDRRHQGRHARVSISSISYIFDYHIQLDMYDGVKGEMDQSTISGLQNFIVRTPYDYLYISIKSNNILEPDATTTITAKEILTDGNNKILEPFLTINNAPPNIAFDLFKEHDFTRHGITSENGNLLLHYDDDFVISKGSISFYMDSKTMRHDGLYNMYLFDEKNDQQAISIPTTEDKSFVYDTLAYVKVPISYGVTLDEVYIQGGNLDKVHLGHFERDYLAGESIFIPVIPHYDTIYLKMNGTVSELKYENILGGRELHIVEPKIHKIHNQYNHALREGETAFTSTMFAIATESSTLNAVITSKMAAELTLTNNIIYKDLERDIDIQRLVWNRPRGGDPLELHANVFVNGELQNTKPLGFDDAPTISNSERTMFTTHTRAEIIKDRERHVDTIRNSCGVVIQRITTITSITDHHYIRDLYETITYRYDDVIFTDHISADVKPGDVVEIQLVSSIHGELFALDPNVDTEFSTLLDATKIGEVGRVNATINLKSLVIQTST